DRAEVAVAIHERVAERDLLHHPHQRLVHRRVTVRVVFTEHLADHAGGLLVGAVEREPQLRHRVEHAPMNRFEAIADVRQRAPDDHGHGVVEVRLPHLLFDRNWCLALWHGCPGLPYRTRRGASSPLPYLPPNRLRRLRRRSQRNTNRSPLMSRGTRFSDGLVRRKRSRSTTSRSLLATHPD